MNYTIKWFFFIPVHISQVHIIYYLFTSEHNANCEFRLSLVAVANLSCLDNHILNTFSAVERSVFDSTAFCRQEWVCNHFGLGSVNLSLDVGKE